MMRKPERKLFTWMNIRMITGEEKETDTTWVRWRKMKNFTKNMLKLTFVRIEGYDIHY